MNDYAMIDGVQGITHVHLKQTEIRHKPKRIEEKVKSSTHSLPFVVTTSRSLRVSRSFMAAYHHRSVSSWNSC